MQCMTATAGNSRVGEGPVSYFSIPGDSEVKMAPVAKIRKWEGELGMEKNEGSFFVLFCCFALNIWCDNSAPHELRTFFSLRFGL